MNQLLSPQTLDFFASYLLAGFVFMSVRSWFVAGERPKINETLVESLILSLINQMIALFTIAAISTSWRDENPSIVLVLQNVAQPFVLGLAVGWMANRNWFPQGLRRLVMPTVRPVNPAVDFAFDSLGGPSYVVLRFEDGGEIYGYFGKASMASFENENGGIFLEAIYDVDADDWFEVFPRRSAWIDTTKMRSIEFLDVKDVEHA